MDWQKIETAPKMIWVAGTPQECGQYFQSCVEAEGAWGGTGIQYIRTDAPELVALRTALIDRDGGAHDADCKSHRCNKYLQPYSCNCGHDDSVAALAAFDAITADL